MPGLIPMGLLAYGLYSKRRGFTIVGGVWLALDLIWLVAARSVAVSSSYTSGAPGAG